MRDFHLQKQVLEEYEKASFYAEINCLTKQTGHTIWCKVFPSVVPLTVARCKVSDGFIIRVSICKEQQVCGLEIPLPMSRMKKTSECFLQWRDKRYGGAWGLNFLSEKDIKKFLKICVLLPDEKVEESEKNEVVVSVNTPRSSLQKFASEGSINFVGLQTNAKDNAIYNDNGSESDVTKPAIRKSLVPTTRSLSRNSLNSNPNIPVGFDASEYEFLTKSHMGDSDLDMQSGKSSSAENLSLPCLNDDSLSVSKSSNSESLFNARPASAVAMNRTVMTTRKAAWLLVKNILIHSKKGKLDLAPNRRWKQYWVALKGVELLFYNADEKTATTDDLDEPVFELDVDGCIVQAVPEHARLENVFSLSSKSGNAYYLQATSQTEVENWIHCIHSSAATALSRRKGADDIVSMLKQEIHALSETLQTDEKLKKMAVLQLKVEKEAQARQTMNEQIIAWSNSLELHHAEYFRLRCYLAAMEGVSNPNPQDLLSHISRSTKHALSKIGIFSVTSFHSYVNTRNANNTPPPDDKHKAKSRSKAPGLRTKLINSLKVNDDNVSPPKSARSSTKNRPKSVAESSGSSESNSSKPSKQKKSDLHGHVGNLLYIKLPSDKTTTIPYENELTISGLTERICLKHGLDSEDYFIMLLVDDENQHGLLDYTIPKDSALLDLFHYTSIKLCPVFIFDVTLTNPADYEHGPFGIEINETPLDHRIIVTQVEEGSQARKLGVLVEDEVIEINGQTIERSDTNTNFRDITELFNTSSSLSMKLKSKRIDDPKKRIQTTDNIINFLVCPPPPKSMQPMMSDDLLNTLIVPAPSFDAFDGESGSVVSSKSYEKVNSCVEIKAEDIDEFLQQTQQVNMMTREMNAVVLDHQSHAPPSKPGIKLQKAIIELVETEKTYVKNLRILLERYLIPLKEEDFLSKDEAELLVANVREIYEFQTNFFERVKAIVRNERRFELMNEASDFQNVLYLIGELFLEYVDKFKLYSTFCSCHSRAVKLLELNTNKALKAFLLARNPKQQHTGTLESYLITPIQRILRYPLLMKTMMKMMTPDSDEYNCMKNALVSVERVADYINEMQRISETYTPIFQEMTEAYSEVEKVDVGVDNLLHYGKVQWSNHNTYHHISEEIGKNVAWNDTNNNNDLKKTDAENLTIFIFKNVIVLISDDPNLRKKASLSSLSFTSVTTADIKFHAMIPVTYLTLRDHAWSENDTDQIWEIVDTSPEDEENEITYKFVNRTAEEKKVFVNAIKESKKLNKIANSHLVAQQDRSQSKRGMSTSGSDGKSDNAKKKSNLYKSGGGGSKKSPSSRTFSLGNRLMGKTT